MAVGIEKEKQCFAHWRAILDDADFRQSSDLLVASPRNGFPARQAASRRVEISSSDAGFALYTLMSIFRAAETVIFVEKQQGQVTAWSPFIFAARRPSSKVTIEVTARSRAMLHYGELPRAPR